MSAIRSRILPHPKWNPDRVGDAQPVRQEKINMATRKSLPKLILALACSAAILWLVQGCGIIDPDYQCGTESLRQANQTRDVFLKYESLFRRQPNSPYVERGFLSDEKTGQRTGTWGIVIIVDEKVDQDTLPPEDRIPESLEDVPVQIITSEIANMEPPFQGGFQEEKDVHYNLVMDVMRKNRDLFRRNPVFSGLRLPYVETGGEPGNRIWSMQIYVSEKVHQLGLSPTVRIPSCLEDVPVKITVDPN